MIVPRNAQGHFQIGGRVDGRRLTFMVDTGASVIALTAEDAASLGIHPLVSGFTAMVRTANGTVRAAPVELGMVEIEDITVHNCRAGDAGRRAEREPARHVVFVAPAPLGIRRRQAGAGAVTVIIRAPTTVIIRASAAVIIRKGG